MKKALIAVLAFMAVVAILAVVIVSLQPDTFKVERSATMAASPDEVFSLINDLKAWDSWSPWKELDPAAKMTVSDPSAGKGASTSWSGNDQAGEGTLTIVESVPGELVELDQEFVRPLPGKARMTFELVLEGGGTRVTWRMVGHNDFMGKAVCLIMDMDTVVGDKLAQALANMKSLAERRAAEKGGVL